MPLDPVIQKGYEDAAQEAIAELVDATPANLNEFLHWYLKWCMKATYKYLGKALVALAKERNA